MKASIFVVQYHEIIILSPIRVAAMKEKIIILGLACSESDWVWKMTIKTPVRLMIVPRI